jgi:hypothetical protein
MHYLKNLLPTLALAASIDALVVRHHKTDSVKPAAKAAIKAGAMTPEAGNPATSTCGNSQNNSGTPQAAGGAPAPAAAPAAGAGAKAIYFMTNQDENSVMMLPVQDDGLLAPGSVIVTGGKGASLIDAKTGQPAASDTLASQAAVRVVGSSLFAVNAGSNSLSMFAIDPADPAKLAAVGQAVPTGGDVRLP